MLFDLPSPEVLYEALLARDPAMATRALVGVTSTGIFCRLTCTARKPKFENCRFFADVASCLEAGFRPCKRCRPLLAAAGSDPVVTALLPRLEAEPERRWREEDLVALSFDPSTVRRAFKRQLGMTFLEFARLQRLRVGFTTLAQGAGVIDAQLAAGYESASAFRDAFANLLGRAPGKWATRPRLFADWLDTPLGAMIAIADDHALHLLEFADRKALPRELKRLDAMAGGGLGIGGSAIVERLRGELADFFADRAAAFTLPLVLHGSAFQRAVWRALGDIPAGETSTYGQLANAIGQPTATRAVARANGANQIALLIPCHRVIGSDGTLTGYGGGLWRKRQLIEIEAQFRAGGLSDQAPAG